MGQNVAIDSLRIDLKKKEKRKKKKKVCYYIVIKSNYKGGNCIIPLNRIISCFLFRLCLLIVNFPILGK